MKARVRLLNLNGLFFAIGMVGVWVVTHSWWALLWTWVAALHFTLEAEKPRSGIQS